MQRDEAKIQQLIAYCQGVYHKENGKELYQKYLEEIMSITPQELIIVQHEQLKMGYTSKQLLSVVDKLINVFYKPLSAFEWKRPEKDTFLADMIAENQGLVALLDNFKDILKENDLLDVLPELKQFVESTRQYKPHLEKIENIVFPYLEKKAEFFDGMKIMWSLHDELRLLWKELTLMLTKDKHTMDSLDLTLLNTQVGKLYFLLYGLVQKQELIMFPAATKLISDREFIAMRQQSAEYPFAFIETPDIKIVDDLELHGGATGLDMKLITSTGNLSFEQIKMLLDVLPLDMTLVDENDKVAYFSRPKERIFPRSAAIIGRDVRNCHPPESVHVVEEILASFKNGTKDDATFWIQMRGMFIYIQYFALRNEQGEYKGTLEVSQELTKLRALEGERRLLDWE